MSDIRRVEAPVISLFSGAMGLDLGMESAGLDVRVSQDIDRWCKATADANGRNFIHGDIREMLAIDPSAEFLLRKGGVSRDEVFAIVGGPPCQAFSTAGKRGSFGDPRGSLFREFIKAVEAIMPRFFVMENVRGLLSAPVRKATGASSHPEEMPGSAFAAMLQEFDRIGYATTYGILNAVDYGVPQLRERVIVIGSRDGEAVSLPSPTHFKEGSSGSSWVVLGDVIRDLEGKQEPCGEFSGKKLKYIELVPQGGNWRNLPPEVVQEAMGGAMKSGGGRTGFFRRLSYSAPSPTLLTSPTQKATLLCHPVENRPLSVREYARIQQFPDDWVIAGSVRDQYRQIGNAVPVGLGAAVGRVLADLA